MKRLKSIDTFRGLSMLWMIIAHLMHWWLRLEDYWFYEIVWAIFDVFGACAFLFISGLSTSLAYRKRKIKAENLDNYDYQMIRIEYYFRAFCILLLAIVWNLIFALFIFGNPIFIWTWFVLLTAAVSLLIAWPLLKTSKSLRIILGAIIWILNQIILAFLTMYEGQSNIFGILHYILYNPTDLNPILAFFPFFLFGTVVGEVIFEVYRIDNEEERMTVLKKKLIFPLVIIGPCLIVSGILFNFPTFLQHRTFPWMIYVLGVDLTFLAVLISAEEILRVNTKKNYNLFFYFSYYSLSIYFAHNLLYFLFLHQLTPYNIWFCIVPSIIIMGLILRIMYRKLGQKASVKRTIGRLGAGLAEYIYEKKR